MRFVYLRRPSSLNDVAQTLWCRYNCVLFCYFFPLIYTLAEYSVRSRNLVRPLMEQQCSALVMLEVCRGITGFLRL